MVMGPRSAFRGPMSSVSASVGVPRSTSPFLSVTSAAVATSRIAHDINAPGATVSAARRRNQRERCIAGRFRRQLVARTVRETTLFDYWRSRAAGKGEFEKRGGRRQIWSWPIKEWSRARPGRLRALTARTGLRTRYGIEHSVRRYGVSTVRAGGTTDTSD